MCQHLLIAIDGSDYSLRAAAHGLSLAKSSSAKASAITVTPTWRSIGLSEIARGRLEEEYEGRAKAHGERCLAKVAALAVEKAISCDPAHVTNDHAYQAIVDTASARGCDLIVVGSHGRRGLSGLLSVARP